MLRLKEWRATDSPGKEDFTRQPLPGARPKAWRLGSRVLPRLTPLGAPGSTLGPSDTSPASPRAAPFSTANQAQLWPRRLTRWPPLRQADARGRSRALAPCRGSEAPASPSLPPGSGASGASVRSGEAGRRERAPGRPAPVGWGSRAWDLGIWE